MKIEISEIKVNPGRREADLTGINELARSISEVGLLNLITIDPDHTLIAGLHRLEAAKRLGWTETECTVCGLEGLQAELAEIDENVVRTALSQAAGINRAIGKNVSGKMSPTSKSFARDTAGKLGVSVRTVERTMQTMKGLTKETRDVFRELQENAGVGLVLQNADHCIGRPLWVRLVGEAARRMGKPPADLVRQRRRNALPVQLLRNF